MNIMEFRQDLNSGMSINDACIKHETTFKDAFVLLQHEQHHCKPRGKEYKVTPSIERYIYIRGDTFAVRKTFNGKTKMFGTYDRLEDAIIMREALIQDGWHQTHVDHICDRLGIQRRKGHPNCKVRYH